MAGKFDPVGVAGKRLRKARAKTFGDIKKIKADIREDIRIKGNIFDV